MAKIRISDLAKELGIPSKVLVDRFVKENIEGYTKPSQGIPLGLAETVREWFPPGSFNGDAEGESSSATATLTKPKTAAKKKTSKKSGSDENDAKAEGKAQGEHSVESTPVVVEVDAPKVGASKPDTSKSVDSKSVDVIAETPAADATHPSEASEAVDAQSKGQDGSQDAIRPPASADSRPDSRNVNDRVVIDGVAPPVTSTSIPGSLSPSFGPLAVASAEATNPKQGGSGQTGHSVPATAVARSIPQTQVSSQAPAQPSGPANVSVLTPATGQPAVAAVSLQKPLRPAVALANPGNANQRGGIQPAMRPTISLDHPNRSPVTPAPQMVVPEKTVMKGPQVVRIEKADIVATPRPRNRLDGPNIGPNTGPHRPTGIGTPLTRGGTGVKRPAGDIPTEESEDVKRKKANASGTRRRDLDGRRGEAEAKLREFTEADLIERADRLRSATSYRSGMDTHLRKSGRAGQGQAARTAAQIGEPINIEEPITVRSLSASLGIKATEIIAKLMKQKIFATVNQSLDIETAQMIGLEYGVEIHVRKAPTLEEQLANEFGEHNPIDPAKAKPRPPVVTILGHVDHGKTSLLDKIRSANVAAGEAGGITQHIAAFSVELNKNGNKKRVTFIDTPGHQAFTAMRARGANMTDVVVLVIDAAQGVQPQTVESINHARAANVPIVVAMNKIDLPDASPDKVLGQLAANDLNPVEWGGQVEVVRTSARTGVGIEDLIEILDLQAEILELKADPEAPARGIVVEARVDPGLGSVATVLVQNGTLKVGDVILAGSGFGRVRQLMDSYGKPTKAAPPSTPVLVSGFNEIPSAGDKFFVVQDLDRAREIAAERTLVARQTDLAVSNRVSLDNIFAARKDEKIKTINLIVKADVQGSVETLEKTITDQNTEEVRVKVIHSAVGAINQSDVELATASDAVIIGFHVVPDEKAQELAEQRHVEIRTYRVIYEIFDDLKKALSGMLEPEVREKHHGWIEIREVFKVSKVGNVAGCYVTEGYVSRGSKIRLVRDGAVVTEGLAIDTLRRIKEDVKEVKLGFECGIKLANYDDIKVGDKLEAYVREEFRRTL